ncbi:hypothetical protein F2Q69_00061427 [Brassica cretica]|uniref:Uncharacterized protein n=1 Tax=Brassica cretica TaxID=69181 RepID=A0A8S9RJA1_BRACR|nr:hypothetical protein F2Q69_00061427 [Brassica cretica]
MVDVSFFLAVYSSSVPKPISHNLGQDKQVEVNENPPDALGAGASKDVLDVLWMDDMITWLPKKGLVRAKLKGRAFWKSKTFILKSMNISGEGRLMAGLKSTSNG